MNFKTLLVILFIPFYIFSQNISYEVSEPIEANDKRMYGNHEIGFVKITSTPKILKIYTIETKSLKIIETVENKSLLKDFFIAKILVFNDKLNLFLTKKGNETYDNLFARSSNELYIAEINISTGKVSEPKLIYKTDSPIDVNHNTIPGYRASSDANRYTFEINKSKTSDFIFIKFIEGNENFYDFHFSIVVLDKSFNEVAYEVFNIDIPKNFFWVNDYEYINNTLYLSFKYQNKFRLVINSKNKHSKIPFVITKNKDKDFVINYLPVEERSSTKDLIIFSLDNKNIIAQYFNYYNRNGKVVTLDATNEFSAIDEKVIPIKYIEGKYIEWIQKNNIYYNPYHYRQFTNRERINYSFEKDFITYNFNKLPPVYKTYDRETGLTFTEKDETGTFNIFSKTDKQGKILFATLLPVKVDNLCFYVNQNINSTFLELDKDGKTIHLSSIVIDSSGEIIQHKKLITKNGINSKLYYLFDQCIFLDENTISSYAYIKKKEDLVIKVKFEE
jgi:hypothetical protein